MYCAPCTKESGLRHSQATDRTVVHNADQLVCLFVTGKVTGKKNHEMKIYQSSHWPWSEQDSKERQVVSQATTSSYFSALIRDSPSNTERPTGLISQQICPDLGS